MEEQDEKTLKLRDALSQLISQRNWSMVSQVCKQEQELQHNHFTKAVSSLKSQLCEVDIVRLSSLGVNGALTFTKMLSEMQNLKKINLYCACDFEVLQKNTEKTQLRSYKKKKKTITIK